MRDRTPHAGGHLISGRGLSAGRLHVCLIWLILILSWLPLSPAAAAPNLIEDLRYRLAVLVWPDAARVRVTLRKKGKGRLVAEVSGETQGLIKLLSGNRKERLRTEMLWRKGRLAPVVYREEAWRHGKHALKEYRFDYHRSRLSLWQWQQGKGLVKKWETTLQKQVYDPLSAFYNCRLRLLGPTQAGETSTIPGIPYPRPEALEVRLGPETKGGRKAMVSLINPVYTDSRGKVFAFIDARRVPRRVWTTVFGVTVTGTLLPDSLIMPAHLPGSPKSGPLAVSRRPDSAATKNLIAKECLP
jgi:hypothetical protein